MSLLSDIQERAISSEEPITDLLRRCMILAERLGYDGFADWVDHELNGYPQDAELPAYRTHSAEVRGNFLGYLRSQMKATPIAPVSVDDEDREILFTNQFRDGVANYEEMLRAGTGASFQIPWSGDALAKYGNRLVENFSCTSAWRVVSRGTVAEIIDQVRNRVLRFALEVEKEDPGAGDVPAGASPRIAPEHVQNLYQQFIIGDRNLVAAGGHDVSVSSVSVELESWDQLVERLSDFGLMGSDAEELHDAIDADGDVTGTSEPGSAVADWLGSAPRAREFRLANAG